MRRAVNLGRNVIFVLLLIGLFYQLWLPVTYSKIESMLISSALDNTEDQIALSPIDTSLAASEILGTIAVNSEVSFETSPSVVTTDKRIIAMRKFLIDYRSPLYPYADQFIVEADKYGLDWRLVASIAGVESAFGNLIPYGSNNAWGWKGDRTRPWSLFPTWGDGIHTVTSRLALGYGTELTPFEIEPTYCPPCGQNPAHAWANGVTNFMNELTRYTESL